MLGSRAGSDRHAALVNLLIKLYGPPSSPFEDKEWVVVVCLRASPSHEPL